jgi:hypothetical protein
MLVTTLSVAQPIFLSQSIITPATTNPALFSHSIVLFNLPELVGRTFLSAEGLRGVGRSFGPRLISIVISAHPS